MTVQRILCVASRSIITASVLAQVGGSPVCCGYLYSWPSNPGDQGPDGPCSGQIATVCEAGSMTTQGGDLLAHLLKFPGRTANCYTYQLGRRGISSAVHASCRPSLEQR